MEAPALEVPASESLIGDKKLTISRSRSFPDNKSLLFMRHALRMVKCLKLASENDEVLEIGFKE